MLKTGLTVIATAATLAVASLAVPSGAATLGVRRGFPCSSDGYPATWNKRSAAGVRYNLCRNLNLDFKSSGGLRIHGMGAPKP